jgi:hypothetical protein
LTSQFRSHPEILRLFNERFYGGRLQSSFSGDASLSGRGAFIEKLQKQRVVMVDTSTLAPCGYYLDKSKANLVHALVIQRVAELLRTAQSAAAGEVGVISPYRPQVGLAHSVLRESGLDAVTACGTVHRFQGDERPTIVLDLTESAPHRVGAFLGGASVGELSARLLNVALSRAQHFLVVVADGAHLEGNLGPEHLMFGILTELKSAGAVVDARELFSDDGVSEADPAHGAQAVRLLSAEEIYPALVADLVEVRMDVTFLSERVDTRGLAILEGVLTPRIREGVRVAAVVGSTCDASAIASMQSLGVQVSVAEAGAHVSGGVVIDDNVVWTFSVPPLSSEGQSAPQVALRVSSPSAAGFIKRSALQR